MLTRNLKELLKKYHIVILTECDELMVTHNENLKDYLIKTYKQYPLKNGSTPFDILRVNNEKDYILGDKISKIRNYLFKWPSALKHTIHTSCLKELPNGFLMDMEFLIIIFPIHIQCLNSSYFTKKINQRIRKRDS